MAEKTELEIHAFRMVCPICERQLSISVPDTGMRPLDWPPNVLGVADCRGCQRDYLVTMPPELENALVKLAIIRLWRITYAGDRTAVIDFLQRIFRD